jgi:hypothetical protein
MSEYKYTTYAIRRQLAGDTEDDCTHDDTECGYCIDCGEYVLDNYDNEPEINPDR